MALTKYEEGSMGELWTIALPLMISSFSVLAMLFVDRLMLANYSTAALNTVVPSATLGWAFMMGWMSLTGIAEVFVAQYNGAGEKRKLGEPVWQMFWLALGSVVCFLPLSIWGGGWFFPDKPLEQEYFGWMMVFGPVYPVYGALCSFFIGQGKLKVITILSIVTNALNGLLNYFLIRGIEGVIPALGITGSAIATGTSVLFQVLVIGAIFISKRNREVYGTHAFQLKYKAMWQCIRIGLPNACFSVLEIAAWAFFYILMEKVSQTHITIASIGQSILILLFFFSEGMNKAAATVAGNLIGAKKPHLISKMLFSGVKLQLLFFLFIFAGALLGNDLIITYFLPEAHAEWIEDLRYPLQICLVLDALYLLFEGLKMLLGGTLTAAGDTLFLLVSGALSIWFLLILPVYFFVVVPGARVEIAMLLCVLYSFAAAALYYGRFLQGKWRALSISN